MDTERKSKVRKNVVGDVQSREDFGRQLLLLRLSHYKTQVEWAEVVGFDPSTLSLIETGKRRNIPPRDVVIEWGVRWDLDWNERAQLLLSGRFLPELPDGFGTQTDRFLLAKSFRELVGDIKGEVFSKALIARCADLITARSN